MATIGGYSPSPNYPIGSTVYLVRSFNSLPAGEALQVIGCQFGGSETYYTVSSQAQGTIVTLTYVPQSLLQPYPQLSPVAPSVYNGVNTIPIAPPTNPPNQGEPTVPNKTALLKKDLKEGMAFIATADVITGADPIKRDMRGVISRIDNQSIVLQFEGWHGGHDDGQGSPDQDRYGFSISQLNSYFELVTKPKVDFDSVILADQKKEQIIHALKQIDNYQLIFVKWGFEKTFEKGKGISMLFYGPPGTGKTLMAQAIANKLDYTLNVVSNADIQSSVPGEAERNIRKFFKDSGGKTVLLFDECDSLIYSRASVGAILGAQINELLSQLERFEGIAIFTTNRLGTLDEAVNRRLSIKVEFAMPSIEERVKIWQRMFPQEAPLDPKIDWRKLARNKVAGGHIKNAVLRAAREAATQDLPDIDKRIKMAHLSKGINQEMSAHGEFTKAKNQWEGRYRSRPFDLEQGSSGLKVDNKRELKHTLKSIQEMKGEQRG